MKRYIDNDLISWKNDPKRKSLLVRGARQVGKTYSIREFAKNFETFIEVNFESDREVHSFFEKDLNPDTICRNLSAYYNIPISDGSTLLFFDEIQACIPAISSLRFFYEKRPGLHIVSAGSLLEFALEEIPSFGVGRIQSLFMYPLSFDEFLLANQQEKIIAIKQESTFKKPLNNAIHSKLLEYLKQYLLLGGLPEVVQTFIDTGDYLKSQAVLDQLIIGLKDDFAKYKKKVPVERISEIFNTVVNQSGNKFNISKVPVLANHHQIKAVLNLLNMAGLIYFVQHTSANGLPLGAEVNPKRFKVILFDHGIFQRLLGLNLSEHLLANSFSAVNKGNLAEQYVGTELIKLYSKVSQPQLFFWNREKRGSNAEVDYILQKNDSILPLEVKSGTQGKMQSLWIFLKEKKINYGARISLENFSSYENILVYPLYAVKNIFL